MGDRVGEARLDWVPELGGKITSLRFGAGGSGADTADDAGREWLAPPVRTLAVPAPGQDWAELDCSGWDECLPNIGAAPGEGLSDHGDVWRLPWTTTSGPASGSVAPPHRTYHFARDITSSSADSTLRIDYRLKNLGRNPLRWAWAQHMLLAADDRTRIVASSPMNLRVDSVFSNGAAFPDGELNLEPTTVIELDDMVGRAAKLWLEPPLPAIVAVVRNADSGTEHDTDWLAWRIADASFPHLGLWLNLGGWGEPPLRQVAVEPAFGAYDDPADAYADLAPLAPGDERAWSVLIEAGTGLLPAAKPSIPESE